MREYLKSVELFKGFTEDEQRELEPYLKTSTFKKNGVIFNEGDPSANLFIVIKGKVKITKFSQGGREVILEIISPYEVFGCVAVMKSFPYPATAIAMENSEVLKISKSGLFRMLERYPSLMSTMTAEIAKRTRSAHETTKSIALERVEARIAALLLKLVEKSGKKADEGVLIDMRLTKQDIAEMVGTSVETSIRTMTKLKKLDIIKEVSGKVIIIDTEGLKSLVA